MATKSGARKGSKTTKRKDSPARPSRFRFTRNEMDGWVDVSSGPKKKSSKK